MISIIFLLFLVIDPIGNLPIFISILKNIPNNKRLIIIFREMLLSLVIMSFFLFVGDYILIFLKLNFETISISGGIILFLISIKMLFSNEEKNNFFTKEKEPFLIPLAIPLTSGPSTLSTIILLTHQYPNKTKYLFTSLLISWMLSLIILVFSNLFLKLLGLKIINALEKIMGLIMIMISIQMILEGIKKYYFN